MKKSTTTTLSSRFRRWFRKEPTRSNLNTNKLIHPRFVLKETDLTKTKTVNSLLFLMYSQENESLFI